MDTPASSSATIGGSFNVSYQFQNVVTTATSYHIFVHVTDSAGNIIFQDPAFFPPTSTTAWSGNITINHSVAVPSSIASGTYQIRIGLSNPNSPYDRLTLSPGPGVTTDGQQRYTVGTL